MWLTGPAPNTIPIGSSGSKPGDPLARQARLQQIEIAPGFDTGLTDLRAITGTLEDIGKQMKRVADSVERFSMPEVDPGVRRAGTRRYKEEIDEAVSAYSVSPASRGAVRTTREMAEEEAPGLFSGAWKPGEPLPSAGTTLGRIQQHLGKKLSQRADNPGAIQLEEVTVDTPDGPVTRMVHRQPDMIDTPQGPVSRAEAARAGINLPAPVDATPDEVDQFNRSQRKSNYMRQLGGALMEGEGVMGTIGAALPTGAMKVLGPAGIALGAVQQGLTFMEGQREANADWRKVSGGGEMDAFKERGREGLFKLRMRGTMGGERAAELFEGVSKTGITGNQRDQALDFAVDKFRDYGMDIADSLTLINESLKDGNIGLGDFSMSLDKVTEAAKQAGGNTDEARKQYIKSFQEIAPILGGDAANALATQFQASLAGLGDQFAGLGLNFGQSNIGRMAANMGVTRGQALGIFQGMRGGLVAAQEQQRIQTQEIDNLMGGRTTEVMQQYAAQQGYDLNNLNSFQAKQIGNYLMRQGLIDPRQVQRSAERAGISGVTFQNAAGSAVLMAQGELGLNPDDFKAQDINSMSEKERRDYIKQYGGIDLKSSSDQKEWEDYVTGKGPTPTNNWNVRNTSKPKAAYAAWALNEGTTAPAIEALINAGYKGKDRFLVQTDKGQRDVSFDEAMKYYPEQLASGEAVLIKGSNDARKEFEGASVSEITGQGNEKYAGSIGKADQGNRKDIGREFDAEKWEKDQAEEDKDKAKNTSKIVVEAAPALRDLINFTGPGVTTTYGPGTSQPNPYTMPTGRTGVNGS